jgi:hypothetical protein
MLEILFGLGLFTVLVIGPLAGRVWADRRRARALVLQADLTAAANHVLGGESLLTVHVEPGLRRQAGRVMLDAPTGWGWLVEAVWEAVMARVPEGWEIVVRAAGRAPVPTSGMLAEPLQKAA